MNRSRAGPHPIMEGPCIISRAYRDCKMNRSRAGPHPIMEGPCIISRAYRDCKKIFFFFFWKERRTVLHCEHYERHHAFTFSYALFCPIIVPMRVDVVLSISLGPNMKNKEITQLTDVVQSACLAFGCAFKTACLELWLFCSNHYFTTVIFNTSKRIIITNHSYIQYKQTHHHNKPQSQQLYTIIFDGTCATPFKSKALFCSKISASA